MEEEGLALKYNIDSKMTLDHMHHDKEIVQTLKSQAVTLQKVQELGSEAMALRVELAQEKQVATEARVLADTVRKQMEQQKETIKQLQAKDVANHQRLARTKQAMAKLHQRLARSKRMVMTLRADADANQKLLELEMNNTKKMQADAEANRHLRDQEKLAWTANANANRKQLIEAKALAEKLRTTAEITQKEIQQEKRKVKKLRSDVVMVQEQLDREKQARAEAKTNAVMAHKQLEHEKETVTNLTHSLGHVKSELEVAVLMASDTSKLNSMQLQQAATDISRRIVLADAALRTEYSRAVDALEAASMVREKKLKSAHAQIEKKLANAHQEEVAKIDKEARTVTRHLRQELAEVRVELNVQTNRANAANLVTKQTYAIAQERKQEIARLQQTEREHVLAATAQKRKEIALTQSLTALRSELKNAVGNAATTNKLHDLQLQELDEELYAVRLQEQKEKAEITRRTMITETTLKEQYSQAMAKLEAAAAAREQNQNSLHEQTQKALKHAHQKEVTRLDAKIRNITHEFRRELVELDSAHNKQIIQQTSRVEAEALSAKQAHAAAKQYEQKILQLQQRERENSLSMAVAKEKEIQLTQQLRSELEVAVLKAADTTKLNKLQLQQAAEDISRQIVLAEAALKTEHRLAVAELEAASVVREKKLKSAHAEIEKKLANTHREEVAKIDKEARTVTRHLRRELAEVRAELNVQTTRANAATIKYENILLSEYKIGLQNSRESPQQSVHHLASRREQTLQQNQQQYSMELQKTTKYCEENNEKLEAKRSTAVQKHRAETQQQFQAQQYQLHQRFAMKTSYSALTSREARDAAEGISSRNQCASEDNQDEILHVSQPQLQQTRGYVGVDVTVTPDVVRDRREGTNRSASSQASSYRLRTQESQWSKAKLTPMTPVCGHSPRLSPTPIDICVKEIADKRVEPVSTPKRHQQRDERAQELLERQSELLQHQSVILYHLEQQLQQSGLVGTHQVRESGTSPRDQRAPAAEDSEDTYFEPASISVRGYSSPSNSMR